jgi:hypothetical protein
MQHELQGLTIGIYMGTGRDGGGVGMLQHEYVQWAKRNGVRLITWFHKNAYTPNWRASSELAEEGERREIDPLTASCDCFQVDGKALDALLLFKPPQPVKDQSINNAQAQATIDALQCAHDHGTKIMMYHFDYSASSVERRLFYQHPEMLDTIDMFWANSGHNALFRKMMEKDQPRGLDLMKKAVFRCHQIISDADTCMANWSRPEDKHLRQFYYQSRPITWKGYVEILKLKQQLSDVDCPVNVTLNGLNPNFDSKKHLYVDDHASVKDRVIIPGVSYDTRVGKNAPDKSFSDDILPKTMIYGAYDHVDGLRLMRDAGFGVYFTRLETWHNFFPENATFDIVKSGTIACLPAWYFDHDLFPFQSTHDGIDLIEDQPEDIGAVTWLPDHESSTRRLAQNIEELAAKPKMYDQYRRNMLDWMDSRFNADTVLNDMINVLLHHELTDRDGVFSDEDIKNMTMSVKRSTRTKQPSGPNLFDLAKIV